MLCDPSEIKTKNRVSWVNWHRLLNSDMAGAKYKQKHAKLFGILNNFYQRTTLVKNWVGFVRFWVVLMSNSILCSIWPHVSVQKIFLSLVNLVHFLVVCQNLFIGSGNTCSLFKILPEPTQCSIVGIQLLECIPFKDDSSRLSLSMTQVILRPFFTL